MSEALENQAAKGKRWYWLAVIGIMGLIFWILAWNIWLAPKGLQLLPLSVELAILLLPLALLLRGVLNAHVETHAYASFIAIFYAFLGFWFAFSPNEAIYGYIMLLFTFFMYLGGFLYAKTVGKPLEKKETV